MQRAAAGAHAGVPVGRSGAAPIAKGVLHGRDVPCGSMRCIAPARRQEDGLYYVIEAVRWGDHGHISHVRWHTVRFDGERIQRGESTVAPVVDAAEVCKSAEVRVFVDGEAGRFFRMHACEEGIDAEVDDAGTPLRERMAHLPTF